MALSSSQKAVEAGGSQFPGKCRGGENDFSCHLSSPQKKKQKSRANDLVSYLKPFSFGLREV